MTPNPTHPCPTCLGIELNEKIAQHDNNAEKAADVRDWAAQHVSFHNAGLAHGQLTPGVVQIANDGKDNEAKR